MRLHCVDEENSLCLKTRSSQTVPFLQLPWEQKCANSPIFIVSLEVQWLEGFFGWLFFSSPFLISFFNWSSIIGLETCSAGTVVWFTVNPSLSLNLSWSWGNLFLMNRFGDDGGILSYTPFISVYENSGICRNNDHGLFGWIGVGSLTALWKIVVVKHGRTWKKQSSPC